MGTWGEGGGAQRGWQQFRIGVRVRAESLHFCPTLFNPMDCGPPGSSVHGIPQARILEWVAIPFSRGSSQPNDQTPDLLHYRQILYLSHQGGKALVCIKKMFGVHK